MSYDAINQVTLAIRSLLQRQLVPISPSATVTLLPPGDQLPDSAGVNLYLYRVLESPSTKNQTWRGDRVTPPSNQPVLGLQLYYLLTPLGAQPDPTLGDVAHTMLGIAMQTLFENPILNNVHFPDLDADSALPDYLRNSYEQIKITLLPSDLDELSKIWATINQPYRLSVAYEVSLVELTPTQPSAAGGGTVGSTALTLLALAPPELTGLVPQSGALSNVGTGGVLQASVLQVLGSGFSAPGFTPVLQFGGQTLPVLVLSPPGSAGQSLTAVLPTDLSAGPEVDVQITVGNQTSLPRSFTIVPWLARLGPFRTALDPSLGSADLSLTLTGMGFTANPQAVRFEGKTATTTVTTFNPGGSDTTASVPIPNTLANGVYQVRLVRSDQGASNSRSLEVMPLVNPPVGVTTVTSGGNAPVHQLTINGARLNGTNIVLNIDGVSYQVAPDPKNAAQGTNPAQIVVTLSRLLAAGAHTIAVNVDGHLSRSIALEV